MAALVGGLSALVGVAVALPGRADPWWVWLPVHAVGLSFTTVGVIAWLRRPDNGTGRLMTAVGVTWYIMDLRSSAHPLLFAAGFCFFYLGQVVFTHLVLALPGGRLDWRPARVVAVALYLTVATTQPLRYLSERPRAPQSWASTDQAYSIWAPIGSVAGLVFTLAALGLVLWRWILAGRPARRRHALVWVTGAATGFIVLATTVASLAKASPEVHRQLALAYALALIFTPFAILVGVLRVRLARIRVADLVMRLEATSEPADLRDALADALGDPSLEVCFWLPDRGGYVDSEGRGVPPPDPDRREVTLVARHGQPLAALVHDPSLAEQRPLVDAVVAAARLALENARLHAAHRAQLAEVRASRARIVAAADAERHRIQRDLHDGAQHKLLAISMLVGQARAELPESRRTEYSTGLLDFAATELRHVIRELRELTEGIDPPALTEQGLATVVEALAERAPLPVAFDVPQRRWPEPVERTAYFVINEALANAYKHAAAGLATVRVAMAGETLVVEVADDGVGGADPARGTGLRGLRDRVSAIGGTLRLRSAPGAGTRIVAELPCGS